MPPEQCPDCGRFLRRDLVDGLAELPAPCPRCGVELSASMFEGASADDPLLASTDASVRPPDLQPEDVRGRPDPLSGWDVGLPPAPVRDVRPFPLDTVVVVGAAALGLLLGATFGDRRARDGVLGALGGAIGAGLTRRLWQLP